MHIHFIGEPQKNLQLLQQELNETEHQLSHSHSVNSILAADARACDLIILDTAQSTETLAATVDALRHRHNNALLLCLSRVPGNTHPIAALEAGADMALSHPICETELRARIRALMRRAGTLRGCILHYGNLSLDPVARRAWCREEEISLSQREYAMLEGLMRHPEEVVSKKTILEHVWPEKTCVFSNLVEVFISYLRNKLVQHNADEAIRTVRGAGYMLEQSTAAERKSSSSAA